MESQPTIFVPRPRKLFQRITHLDLALPIRIDLSDFDSVPRTNMVFPSGDGGAKSYLSGVECVDTMIPCCLQAVLDNITLLRPAVGEPAAEGEEGDFESGWPKMAEDLCL